MAENASSSVRHREILFQICIRNYLKKIKAKRVKNFGANFLGPEPRSGWAPAQLLPLPYPLDANEYKGVRARCIASVNTIHGCIISINMVQECHQCKYYSWL